ncbi:MAG: UDP-glucose/GDP-mannose dehydrogenase family protein [Candidatus Omnitrophota bacterium]
MKICVIGTGYVGLVTGTCFAELGNDVICVDVDARKIEKLNNGICPIYEPGLEELVKRNAKEGRISFTNDLTKGVEKSQVIFIAVGTPPKANGEADLSCVEEVCRNIAKTMKSYRLVVEKSTVPVETGAWVKKTLTRYAVNETEFDVASNPEFLREGSAVNDFLKPERIVIGVESEKAKEILLELYGPLKCPIVVTDIKSAEIIKHASNSFLATKISFMNAISVICEKVGADVEKVAEGMGMDSRIGKSFLKAGVGFGGFCFPKDLAAFIRIAEKLGYDFGLLREVENINEEQKKNFVKKIESALWVVSGKTLAVLGLAFKPNTDDMRFAPSIDIINMLQEEGAKIKAFDPQAMERARDVLKDVEFCDNPYKAIEGADALVIITEWNEFKELDLEKIKKLLNAPIVIDGRNIYDPEKMKKMGFNYLCVGRS